MDLDDFVILKSHFSYQPMAVPESGPLSLLILGVAALQRRRRR